MEFTTWPDDFFSKPVCKFGSISIIVHKAHQMLKGTESCFGAHQYPNSNMSNVLTQYLTLVGTLLHNTFSDSTARSRMGSEKQRGGGDWGNKQWGKHSIRPAIVVFLQRGAEATKIFFLRFFLWNPFLRRAQSQQLIFFCVFFFAAKQHVGPGINYFRK